MQFERAGEGRYRCGDSLVVVAETGQGGARRQWRGPGYRYMTVQVWDCLAEYDGILGRGGDSGGEPSILGDTVRLPSSAIPTAITLRSASARFRGQRRGGGGRRRRRRDLLRACLARGAA